MPLVQDVDPSPQHHLSLTPQLHHDPSNSSLSRSHFRDFDITVTTTTTASVRIFLFLFSSPSPTTPWVLRCNPNCRRRRSATRRRRRTAVTVQHEGLPPPCSPRLPPWSLNHHDRRSIGPRTLAFITSSRPPRRISRTGPPVAPRCPRRGSSPRATHVPTCPYRRSPAPRRRRPEACIAPFCIRCRTARSASKSLSSRLGLFPRCG